MSYACIVFTRKAYKYIHNTTLTPLSAIIDMLSLILVSFSCTKLLIILAIGYSNDRITNKANIYPRFNQNKLTVTLSAG